MTTEQVADEVPGVQSVPPPAVKSRFCVPEVKTFTAPIGVPPMAKGNVSETAVEEPSWMWPNPTAVLFAVEANCVSYCG